MPDQADSATPTDSAAPAVIAIPTFKRPDGLKRCLDSIADKADLGTGHRLEAVVVVDNDTELSARPVVDQIEADGRLPVVYLTEELPGVSHVRNRAVDWCAEHGVDALVFIDDDEVVLENWPAGLLDIMGRHRAAAVAGPVHTLADREIPPEVRSHLVRAEHDDGQAMDWLRAGNLALDVSQLDRHGMRFDPEYGLTGGEDSNMTRELKERGGDLRWSATAIVGEHVAAERLTVPWMLERRRTMASAFYRAKLRRKPYPLALGMVVARMVTVTATGLAMVAAGKATGNRTMAVEGQVKLVGVRGAVDAITGRLPEYYKDGNPAG